MMVVWVDFRVRAQLSFSPVDHLKITVRFNQRFRYVENKDENINTFIHTIVYSVLSSSSFFCLSDSQFIFFKKHISSPIPLHRTEILQKILL